MTMIDGGIHLYKNLIEILGVGFPEKLYSQTGSDLHKNPKQFVFEKVERFVGGGYQILL